MALSVGKDNTKNNPVEVSWDWRIAAALTAAPGLATAAAAEVALPHLWLKALSADNGMLGSTAFQLGGVARDGRLPKAEQEYIELYREDDNFVKVKVHNVANTSSFLYHLDTMLTDSVINAISFGNEERAKELREVKEYVRDKNHTAYRTMTQTFTWSVYAPVWLGGYVGG